ncbi:hypothetical protein [Falsiroseomonas sp. E2-1-a4]|uniref:hypothetical protein n=1 Tax=Falsiroseomonas sp. E2-1-a4 TaxID=3239299 RepID=UPI003F32F0CC
MIDANSFDLVGSTFTGAYLNTCWASVSRNLAPASNTDIKVQFVTVADYAELTTEITAGRGQSVAGQGLGVNVLSTIAPSVTPMGGQARNTSGALPVLAATGYSANPVAVTTARGVDLLATLNGALVTKPYAIPEADWQYAAAAGDRQHHRRGATGGGGGQHPELRDLDRCAQCACDGGDGGGDQGRRHGDLTAAAAGGDGRARGDHLSHPAARHRGHSDERRLHHHRRAGLRQRAGLRRAVTAPRKEHFHDRADLTGVAQPRAGFRRCARSTAHRWAVDRGVPRPGGTGQRQSRSPHRRGGVQHRRTGPQFRAALSAR